MATEEELLDYLKWVTADLHETRQRVLELESELPEPIAIIGMACRYPGGAESPQQLWDLVAHGRDAVGPSPADRGWEAMGAGFAAPAEHRPHGGFLADAAGFDAAFFGISPREALVMDPQQRVLLETAWAAVEHAGIDPHSLRGGQAGVFVGASLPDYVALTSANPEAVQGYAATGVSGSVLSGRISYVLGLTGPAATVDTACSSSLVALHWAAHALRKGECPMALVGGVTVMATPTPFVEFAKQGGLASDGRCKSYAAGADGTAWGEGVGVLLVERLSDARRLGHRVWGVLRGSAVNQDGASNGLTAPNGPSQERVILRALADAGLTVSDVDLVEGHGTGTKLGDPIEARALLATYGKGRADGPVRLGSIKSNLGHTQAAAGIAGVIKTVLAMRHELMPATLHVDEPSAAVDWSAGEVELLTEARAWPRDPERPRRAGVSSFGISGTNAHAILEEGDPEPPARPLPPAPGGVAWALSAKSAGALRAQAARLADWASAEDGAGLVETGLALAARPRFGYRAAAVGADRESLLAQLRRIAEEPVEQAPAFGADGVAVLFSGQGSQHAGMGLGLHGVLPVFTEAFDEAAGLLGIDAARLADGADLDRTEVTQPALFALQVAAYRQLEAWGLTATWLGGHSIGELTAAYLAGVWDLEGACRIVAARGRLMGQARSGGAMAALEATEDRVRQELADAEGVGIAAVNGPSSIVVSGDADAVDALVEQYKRSGRRARRLTVSHAFHSHHMDGVLEEFERVLASVPASAPRLKLVSTLTGAELAEEATQPSYWVRQVREAVRFGDAVSFLAEQGASAFLDVSPDGVLTSMISGVVPDCRVVPTLRKDVDEPAALVQAAAGLHEAGLRIDWPAVFGAPVETGRTDPPTYAFEHTRYWLEFPADAFGRDRGGFAKWRYRIGWERVTPVGQAPRSPWLLVTSAQRVPAELVEQLRSGLSGQGLEVAVAELDACEAWESDQWAEFGGILSLLGCGAADGDAAAEPGVGAGLAETLRLIAARAAGAAPPAAGPRIWTLTQGGADAPGGTAPDPWSWQLWGLGKVAALDVSALWGGLIDLDPAADVAELCGDLLGVLTDGTHDQVALRADGVRAARLLRDDQSPLPPAEEGSAWSARGTVLVTGASGSLGGRVARWAAERGAQRVVLASRRGEQAPGAAELREALEKSGAAAEFVPCDVADTQAVRALLAQCGDQLSAVFHIAGTASASPLVEDGATAQEQVRAWSEMMSAKVSGARLLDAHLGDRALDAFVVFSSISGVWGSGGQGAYAAANAYLDGLVAARRARGLSSGTAVAWGPWGGGGMAEGEAGAYLARRGLRPLDPDLAIAALERALVEPGRPATTVVADVDWSVFAPAFALVRPAPLIASVPEAAAALRPDEQDGDPAGSSAARGLAAELGALAPKEQAHRLLELVRSRAAEVLGHAGPESIAPEAAFNELGFDSLTAVELRNTLVKATGVALPATLVFDHPNPAALAGFLRERLGVGGAAPRVVVQAAAVADEPVAIVGMACRYPGGVGSAAEFWDLIAEGRDGMTPFPRDRGWGDLDALLAALSAGDAAGQDTDGEARRRTVEGGFLEDLAQFDADFFGISPREALAMDPQQRLLLETSWEALEHAGIDPTALQGSQSGVFVGASSPDYAVLAGANPEAMQGYTATGISGSVLSGRVSYVLGLTGPAVTVDTACSSSLVALHWAARALHDGECTMALAGGVTVMATPTPFMEFARQNGLAGDGRCKSYAGAADGTGWGEGVGVLVLERLSDARRNGHRVWGLVKGSAVNQDGASNGLTAPNGPSQERVILQALANAGLDVADVDLVEGHGTGTRLGDPIEAQALLATYGKGRADDRPLWLGSVKSNIGHTQCAAGVAGVIKTVLAMQHAVMPATLHVDEPSPQVDWSAGEVRLLTQEREWRRAGERPRRAGVSSFGISGTNAHVIIEEGDAEPEGSEPLPVPEGGVAWPISAKSAGALRAQASRLAQWTADAEDGLVETGLALAARTRFAHRAVVTGPDRAALVEGLRSVASGVPAPGCALGSPVPGAGVLVYPGQGWERVGVGSGLLARGGLFAEVIGECAEALGRWTDFDLVEVLSGGDGAWLERVDVVQPVLWAVMIGLTRVWESLGLDAPVVVGHSQGEIAAAVVAGALSLEDGARVVAVRSRVIRELLAGSGAMVSLAASAAEAADWITAARLTGRVGVAAVNGPHAVTIAGEREAILPFAGELKGRGLRVRVLGVDYASHSPMVERLESVLHRELEGLAPRPLAPGRRWLSTVTGEWMRGEQADAGYWYRNLREQVGFAPAVADLVRAGHRLFVEASAHPVLTSGIEQVLEEADAVGAVTGTLRRTSCDAAGLLVSAARLFTAGVPIDWPALLAEGGPAPAHPAAVPGYAFDRSRYWLETPPGALGDLGAAGLSAAGHPLLGAAVPLADGGHLLTGRLSVAAQPWLADHALGGTVLLAGTALVELALRAGAEAGCGTLRELNLHAPVVLPPDGALTLQIVLGAPRPDGTRDLAVHTRPEPPEAEEWTRHAGGILADEQPAADPAAFAELSGPTWPPHNAVALTVDGIYQRLAESGIAYGPAFQALRRAWRVGDAVFAEVSLSDPTGLDALFGLHPVLLDAAVQVLGLDGLEGLDTGVGELAPGTSVMPFSWSDVQLWTGGAARLRVRVGAGGQGGVSVHAVEESGRPVAAVGALVLRPVAVDRATGNDAALVRDSLFTLGWQEIEAPAETSDNAGPIKAIECRSACEDLPEAVHATVAEALRVVQQQLREEQGEGRPLVLVTRGAVSALDDEPVADLAGAAVWGLIRSVQSEHPGRFVLLDLPADADENAAETACAAAGLLAVRDAEPQLAVREGRLFVPRLARARIDTAADLDWSAVAGTILVTGATGGLGGALVRHLVASGARELLLVSRSGIAAPGADALLAHAAAAGARVRLTSCDLSRREEAAQLFKQLAADGRTLGAVIHLAGVTADSTVEALTGDQLGRVLSAKADAAWHLHELTAEYAPAAPFVLFSSAAATFGSPGMANYAAANAFLDALAATRRAAGLPAASLAWGTWAEAGGMGGRLGGADQQRLTRVGDALGTGEALRLLDLALAADRALLIPTRLQTARMRGLDPAAIPPVLRELVRGNRAERGVPAAPPWTDRLAGLGPEQLREALLALVREQTARVLGHASAEAVPADRTFTELGFDSLTAVEARNALSAATGLRLPATLVFDQPNPRILVEHLSTLLASSADPAGSEGAQVAGVRAAAPAAALSDEDANPIARMYLEACAAGRFDEAWGFARAVARLSPKFDGPQDFARAPEPLVLAEGPEREPGDRTPLVFCFPSFSPASGPHEYTRFATGLRGRRRVLLVRQPGFLEGEPLPESFDALVRVHADTVLRAAGGAPFVLLGRSASGWLAYSLARHLEQQGRGPLAAVLVDTYFGEAQERENLFHGARAMMEREKRSTMLSDVRVTAMGCYEGLIERWHPEPITAPTLLVRATEAFSTAVVRSDGVDWRASMTFPHDTRDVPGDHFSMLEEHAEHTALAMESWLHSTFPGRG